MARTYFVRTFGCQMNEHDSERIAGLLEADGLAPATSATDADVVVLNTCCIRENADNKLYGTLCHLKSLKDRRPDMEIMIEISERIRTEMGIGDSLDAATPEVVELDPDDVPISLDD